jgi:hypothetical protein
MMKIKMLIRSFVLSADRDAPHLAYDSTRRLPLFVTIVEKK